MPVAATNPVKFFGPLVNFSSLPAGPQVYQISFGGFDAVGTAYRCHGARLHYVDD